MSSRWLIMLRIPTEHEALSPESLNPQDALHQQAAAFWTDLGIACTEKGAGFGWWEIGAIVPGERAYGILDAFNRRFKRARDSGLVRIFFWPHQPAQPKKKASKR